MITEKFRNLMKVNGVTIIELAAELDRSRSAVKQRLNIESTFPNHLEEYTRALKVCVSRKEESVKKAWGELHESTK